MDRDFTPVVWDDQLVQEWQTLLQLAVREDLQRLYDWTTAALIDEATRSRVAVVARRPGVIAGLPAAAMTLAEYSREIRWEPRVADGASVIAGQIVGVAEGPARALLSAERVLLNILSHVSGIATLTQKFVAAVAGTKARIYDTRKTTPGYRRLEKYAVRLGGGHNHRTGLFDHILIKDNHLAIFAEQHAGAGQAPADAVIQARAFLDRMVGANQQAVLIEIEVDTLEQLRSVLSMKPDIVLLDNMPPATLREAVALRDNLAPAVELEASGGVRLDTVAEIAATGVDRISAGALTHAAAWLDLGLDWEPVR